MKFQDSKCGSEHRVLIVCVCVCKNIQRVKDFD